MAGAAVVAGAAVLAGAAEVAGAAGVAGAIVVAGAAVLAGATDVAGVVEDCVHPTRIEPASKIMTKNAHRTVFIASLYLLSRSLLVLPLVAILHPTLS